MSMAKCKKQEINGQREERTTLVIRLRTFYTRKSPKMNKYRTTLLNLEVKQYEISTVEPVKKQKREVGNEKTAAASSNIYRIVSFQKRFRVLHQICSNGIQMSCITLKF